MRRNVVEEKDDGSFNIVGTSKLQLDGTAVTSTAAELNKLDGVTSTTAHLNQYVLNCYLPDISTAQSVWVVAPDAGTITKVYSVVQGAFSTADAAITLEIGGTAVTGGAITITQSGSAAGDVDSCTPTAANTVTAGQAIEIITSGAPTDATDCWFTLVMTRS